MKLRKRSLISAGCVKSVLLFFISRMSTNITDIQTHVYINGQLMKILIRSWRANEVQGYILSASEAEWSPITQQMGFYCKVVTTQLSHLRKAATESLSWLLNSPQTAFYDGSHLGCIWMHLSQEPWRPSPWSTAQNAHRMWVKPSRQKTQTLMSSITEACAKNWLIFPDRFTRRCMVLSRYSRAPFQNEKHQL